MTNSFRGFREFGEAMKLTQNQSFGFEVQKRSLNSLDKNSISEAEFTELKEVCLGLLKQNMILQNLNNYHMKSQHKTEIDKATTDLLDFLQ